MPQIALNWLIRRPTLSSVIIGARNETQLRHWVTTCVSPGLLHATGSFAN